MHQVRRRLGRAVAAATVFLPLAAAVPAPGAEAAAAGPQIANANGVTLVRRADGTVWSSGTNINGVLGRDVSSYRGFGRIEDVPAAAQVAASLTEGAIVTTAGRLWTFGENGFGQNGRPPDPAVYHEPPAEVPGLTGVAEVALGAIHAVARKADGTVWTFGDNTWGQLGRADGATGGDANAGLPHPTPTVVAGIGDAVAVAAGNAYHTVVLRADGTVWTFGSNRSGPLGVATNAGTGAANPTPVQVPGLTDVVAIDAGYETTVALRADGTVWTWGSNAFGALGRPAGTGAPLDFTPFPTPAPVPGLPPIAAISTGAFHTVAVDRTGAAWVFGSNEAGQLGEPPTVPRRWQAALVPGVGRVRSAEAGGGNTLFVLDDGTLWGVGDGSNGDFGDGSFFGSAVDRGKDLRPVIGALDRPNPRDGAGRFVAVAPVRLFDSRTAGPALAAGSTTRVPVAGRLGVPGDAIAVTVNLTATDTTGPGYLQAYATDAGTPGASSNVNVERAGQTVAGAAIVPIGADGSITVYSHGGAHMVVDVTGAFVPTGGIARGGRLVAVEPRRVLETRSTGARPAAGSRTRFDVGVLDPLQLVGDATAVVLNVTATEGDGPGYVQAGPAGAVAAGAWSNLNVERAGQTVANLVVVPLGDQDEVELYTQGSTHLVADLVGFFTPDTSAAGADGLFVPVTPGRALDTRPGSTIGHTGGRPAGLSTTSVAVGGRLGVPASWVTAVAANLTATEAVAPGFVQVAAGGALRPGAASTLNIERAGQTVANAALVSVATDGTVDLYTPVATHLLLDVSGWFTG